MHIFVSVKSTIRKRTYTYSRYNLNLKDMNLKKLIYLCVFSFGIINFGYSQVLEKIKGNRDVTIKQTYVDDFNSLIVKNDFEVKIAYNIKKETYHYRQL